MVAAQGRVNPFLGQMEPLLNQAKVMAKYMVSERRELAAGFTWHRRAGHTPLPSALPLLVAEGSSSPVIDGIINHGALTALLSQAECCTILGPPLLAVTHLCRSS